MSLTERGLVHFIRDLFRFHHVLVRDVAYRGIPKADRAEFHELAGKGIDRRTAPTRSSATTSNRLTAI